VFHEISADHSYMKELCHEDLLWERTNMERIYHPDDTEWPLYRLSVHQDEHGVQPYVSRKQDMQSFWIEGEPLPVELARIYGQMIVGATDGKGLTGF
jgi:hypothetical protein